MTLEGAELGIYRLGEQLGRGGMGAVYRASALRDGPAGPSGSEVAVKVFHSELVADERAFARFRLEAEIGKEIRHDNLVRTYGLGSDTVKDETVHFMVMEVIEGRTLKHKLDELGTFPEHLLFNVADQVLAALAEIHARDVVHRDIKPENIIITPDHRVLLMDLGIAQRETAYELTQAGEFVGSLTYAPPEQFTGVDAGPRADIYALGVSLYELATGRNPFEGANTNEILRRKLDEEIDPPRTVAPDIDPFWDLVIHTCTRREPTSRFASAEELRALLAEGERSAWWQACKSGKVIPNAEPALKRLRMERVARLVGREEKLAQLREFQERASLEGGTLLLRGPAGAGKSRLLFEMLQPLAAASGPLIAAGRCVGAGARSYQPFIEILTDLLCVPANEPAALEIALSDVLPPTSSAGANLAAFAVGRLQLGDDFSRDALHGAVADVIRALAAERSCVIAVEDLHLADPGTLDLFAYLDRVLTGVAVGLIGVVADDEGDDGLADLAADTLRVEPLAPEETEELVRRATASDRAARAIAWTLHERSGGNPLIVLEMLNHLRTAGQLVEENRKLEWVGSLDELTIPASLADLTGLKLGRVDEDERETLELGAVLGFEFGAASVAEMLEEKPVETLARLAALERRHKLVVSSGRDSFRFASRQVFDVVYESIQEDLRTEYHDLVAETLLEELDDAEPDGPTAYALLRHLFEAERASDALPYLSPALEHIDANFHASFAAPFLEKVADALADAPAEPRLALAMKLWKFYELLASHADQLRVLEGAAALAEASGDAGAQARVHAYRGVSYWLTGDYDQADAEAQAGLALAREAGDRTREAMCLHTAGVVAYRRGEFETSWRNWNAALEIRREIGERRGQASTLLALAAIQPAMGHGERVLDTMKESLAIWREIGDRRGEARMLMNIGAHLVNSAQYDEGLRYFGLAIKGHRGTGASASEAMTLTNQGHAQHMLGMIDDAIVSWKRALGIFVDLGNSNGELTARAMMGSALGAYGEHDEARAQLTQAIEIAERTGNKGKLVNARRELADVLHSAGEPEEARREFERAMALDEELNDPLSRVLTAGIAARAALVDGEAVRATALLEGVLDDARSDALEAPVILSRLARAYRGVGREDEARACATEALERAESDGVVSTDNGPEIYYTAHLVLDRADLLAAAREIVEKRAGPIRNDSYREYFLNRAWPNSELRTS